MTEVFELKPIPAEAIPEALDAANHAVEIVERRDHDHRDVSMIAILFDPIQLG